MKIVVFDLDDTLYDRTRQVRDTHFSKDINKITPFNAAKDILSIEDYKKILLATAKTGIPIQEKKLRILGIKNYFDETIFCSADEEKQEALNKIVRKYRVANTKNILVIGNRRDVEIRYGNLAGCITVLLNQGKYSSLQPKDAYEAPNYSIRELSEFLPILVNFLKAKT